MKTNLTLFQLPSRVERAFDCDHPMSNPDSPEMLHSSPAHDFTASLETIKSFWVSLSWGEVSQQKLILSILIEVVAKTL